MDRATWKAIVHGVSKVTKCQTQLSMHATALVFQSGHSDRWVPLMSTYIYDTHWMNKNMLTLLLLLSSTLYLEKNVFEWDPPWVWENGRLMGKRTRRYEACQGSYAGMHPAQGFTFQLKLWRIVLSFHHARSTLLMQMIVTGSFSLKSSFSPSKLFKPYNCS